MAPQRYLPESLAGERFYEPGDRGAEARIRERLERIRELRRRNAGRAEEGEGGS